MKRMILALLVMVGCCMSQPHVASASLSVSFIFSNHSRSLTAKQTRRVRRYRRAGCHVFALAAPQQRFALRSLSHAFSAMNSRSFLRVVRKKRFTYTSMSGRAVIRKIKMRHRSLPVFGYDNETNCPVRHTATAFAIHGMIFLQSTYLNRVRRTNNWRRLAQTLAHEWMHGVGFGHGTNGGQGGWKKRNSVPIFIGCLVKYFPRMGRGNRICSRSHNSRRRYRSRRYRQRDRAPRFRNEPFRGQPNREGSWLDSLPPTRSDRGKNSPFYAPFRPSSGDWLNGKTKHPRKTKRKKRRSKNLREL